MNISASVLVGIFLNGPTVNEHSCCFNNVLVLQTWLLKMIIIGGLVDFVIGQSLKKETNQLGKCTPANQMGTVYIRGERMINDTGLAGMVCNNSWPESSPMLDLLLTLLPYTPLFFVLWLLRSHTLMQWFQFQFPNVILQKTQQKAVAGRSKSPFLWQVI